MIMTVEQVQEALADRNCEKVAAETGLSAQVVRNIKAGRTQNPGAKTIEVLSQYLSN